MEANLPKIIGNNILGTTLPNSKNSHPIEECLKDIKSDDNHLANDESFTSSSEKRSPAKSPKVLSFDPYGNLTSSDDPAHDFNTIADFNYVIEGFENSYRSGVESDVSAKNENPIKNGSIDRTSKTAKPKSKSGKTALLSYEALEKAFKPSINVVPTTRSGRHCKQKSEAGFLFGTFNFNEFKKLTSSSPKRNKQSSTGEPELIKINSSNQKLSQCQTSSPKPPTTDPEYSSSEEFQTPPTSKTKKKTKKSKLSSHVQNHDTSISESESENAKSQTKKLGRPRKKRKMEDEKNKAKKGSSLFNHKTTPKFKNKSKRTEVRKPDPLQSLSDNNESKYSSDEPQILNIKNSLRNAKRIKEEKFIGSLEDDVHIIKSSLINSSDHLKEELKDPKEAATPENAPKKSPSSDSLGNTNEAKAEVKAEAPPEEKPNPTTTKSGRQIKKPVLINLSSDKKIKEEKKFEVADVEETHPNQGIDGEKALEKNYPCEYFVGDLVWIMMKGSPIWPAMVVYPKDQEHYTVISSSAGKFRRHRKYHVKFFQDNDRTTWTTAHSTIAFDGKASLDTYLEEVKSSPMKLKKSLGLCITSTRSMEKKPESAKYERWQEAIKEAESYLALDRYERVQKMRLEELKQHTQEQEKVKKRKLSKEKTENNNNDDPNMNEFVGFEESSSSEERNAKRRKLQTKLGSFDVYLQKHIDSCLKDNSSFSQENAKKHLLRKWRKLTPVQKARYRSHRNEEFGLTVDSDESNSESSTASASTSRRKSTSDGSKGTYRVGRNEKVCFICGFAGNKNIVKCKGVCNGNFHLECVGLSVHPTSDFKCTACLSGIHSCFVCKSNEGKIVRCSIPSCGKFYHDACIRKWPQVSKSRQFEKLVCPRHICHMCAANADDMNDPAARTPPFTRCIHCPTTYHTGDTCVAAGIEEISLHYHICTKHIIPKKHLHYNVNWCFCCSKGGSLLLCDQCPAAFHAECMNISAPEGGYICEDCENGKYPVYGDIVWVKVGAHRWWPAQVLHPKYIPDNIENLSHQQGMFCVHFFGSNDYFWVSRGRAFLYQEGDQGSKGGRSKSIEKQFQKALNQVIVAYHKQKKIRDEQEATRSLKGNKKPPPFVRIDTNRPVGNVRLGKLDLSSVNKCECNPFLENPCSLDDKCLNRMLMIECIREACQAGNRCQNQRFQKRLYPNVAPFKTSARGWGLKTKDFIKKGDFVIEYVGELIDDMELKKRIEEMHEVKEENYYFLTIDKDRIIDAGPKGNLARFMNHSCDPNCETQKWTVGADTRVGLFALHDIAEGSELTFNYNLECIGTGKKKCNCGTKKCSGFIGAKIQKPETSSAKKSESSGGIGRTDKKKKKKRRTKIKSSEDECFRCNQSGGDLVLCDATMCPKGYHLKCLDLDSLPKGKWLCPWHYCDECGCKASNRCILCPSSYCRFHSQGKFHPMAGFGNVCLEHKADVCQTLRGQTEPQAHPPRENLQECQAGNTVQKCPPDTETKQRPQQKTPPCPPLASLPADGSLKVAPGRQSSNEHAKPEESSSLTRHPEEISQTSTSRRKSSRLNSILSPISSNSLTLPDLDDWAEKPRPGKASTHSSRGRKMKENLTRY